MISVIAWLLLKQRDGSEINAYISFASSIASLILAVVAIFYAIVANQSQSEAKGTLRTSIDEIGDASKTISSISEQFNIQSDRLVGEISNVSPAVDKLSTRMDAGFKALEIKQVGLASDGIKDAEDIYDYFDIAPYGGKLGFYVLAKSIEENFAFDIYQIFKEDKVYGNFVTGFMHATKAFRPYGLEIDFINSGSTYLFNVSSFGSFNRTEIMKLFLEDYPDSSERTDVDNYFNNMAKAGTSES